MIPEEHVYPCVLLAAGASSRMGRQKLLLPLGGETVVRHIAGTILQVARPLVVVTGKAGAEISSALDGLSDLIIVDNPRWQEGMVSSAQAGIGALLRVCPDCPGFFLHHADKPFVLPDVFAALAARAAGPGIAATGAMTPNNAGLPADVRVAADVLAPGAAEASCAVGSPGAVRAPRAVGTQVALIASRRGVSGHPVYFPSRYIPALLAIAGGERLKAVLDQWGGVQVECGSDAVLEDIDRPEDYRMLAAKYGFACSPERSASARSEEIV